MKNKYNKYLQNLIKKEIILSFKCVKLYNYGKFYWIKDVIVEVNKLNQSRSYIHPKPYINTFTCAQWIPERHLIIDIMVPTFDIFKML